MHFCFICQEDFSESLSYAAKQQVFYCCVNQCHLVSNQDMLDLLLDRALVMLLLP